MTEAWVRDLRVAQTPHEVIVIGGGITGVQVTRELAARGVRVLLLEKADIGSGTSAGTTKFIHGGLRYLEQGDVRTVHESVRERRRLALAAPSLVRPQRFLLPIWDWTRPNRWLLGAGLALYEGLAANKNAGVPSGSRTGRVAWLRHSEVLAQVPWLRATGLRGAYAYYDMANAHPERLLLAILRAALVAGAHALTYARVEQVLTEPVGDGLRVTGVRFTDTTTGTSHQTFARAVVNAAGPWVDQALGPANARIGLRVKRAKGVHLLTRALGGADAVFTRTRSGRHIVVSPWQGMSLIGPTDTATSDSADAVDIAVADIDLLADGIGDISTRPLRPADLLGYTVGIRPLVEDGQRGTYDSSRRFRIHAHAGAGIQGLWSITGGKWTTGRAIGAAVARQVAGQLAPGSRPPAFGGAGELPGFGDEAALAAAAAEIAATTALDAVTCRYLVRLYGTQALAVADLVRADPALGRRLSDVPSRLDIAAQAHFAITDEAAQTLGDVLDRRLVLGTLGRLSRQEVAATALAVAEPLGWDLDRVVTEVDQVIATRGRFEQVVGSWEQSGFRR